jgi:hypothetical protein
MKSENVYVSFVFIMFIAMAVIVYAKPCVADSPKIVCTVEPSGVEQGEAITVVAESDKELKSLQAFIKQPESSLAPVYAGMSSRKCVAIKMEKEEGNKYVGHINTSDFTPGEAIVKVYASDLNKEYATDTVPVKIED